MQIGDTTWRNLIVQGAEQAGILLSDHQVLQMAAHAETLLAWNRKINLTAIVEPRAVAAKHFLDAIWPHAYIPRKGCLLDIGTGGGFPGIPLKIIRPDQPMMLIDSVRKKVNFVREVIRKLGLKNIVAEQIRAEMLAQRQVNGQGGYDVVVCRALKNACTAASIAGPLLAPGGVLCVYQGPGDDEAWSNPAKHPLPPGWSVIAAPTYQLPLLGDRRTLLILSPFTLSQ